MGNVAYAWWEGDSKNSVDVTEPGKPRIRMPSGKPTKWTENYCYAVDFYEFIERMQKSGIKVELREPTDSELEGWVIESMEDVYKRFYGKPNSPQSPPQDASAPAL